MISLGLAPVKIQVVPAPMSAISTVHDRETSASRGAEELQ